jgi:hypothetical protein
MKKEQIYVTIDSEEKRLRAIEILEKAGEKILKGSALFNNHNVGILCYTTYKNYWVLTNDYDKDKTTLDELEALLIPNYKVNDVILSLDELKAQADKLGYDLVEKPYEPKVGDFGMFWDVDDEGGNKYCGFLIDTDDSKYPMQSNNRGWFKNFRRLTEEEKQKIQEAW